MDRLKYHQERLDAKLGFKRDENFRYDFDPIVPENVLDHQENDGIVPKNQQKNTQYHLGFQTGATFDVDESYKESNAYKKYMQTRPEVLEEAKKISDTTGIPYDAIIEDSESMAKAREIYDYKKKVMDFSKVYERYPELKKLNEADGAISLHNIQDVKRVHGDFEALKVGWNTDSLVAERNILGFDKFLGKQVDEKKLEELNKQYQELKEIPTLDEDISMAILGNSAQQARMMARHFIQSLDTVALGATAGAIGNAVLNRNNIAMAPALITGARTALPVAFKTGMAIEMFKESAGSSYLTYIGYKDKFGNQLLSDSEARLYAAATALIETRIEFANYGAVIDILKGSKKTIGAAKVIENIVKNSKDAASVVAQLKTWLSTNAKNLGAVAFGESVEEGAQQISEMGISQIARVNNLEGNIPQYSGSDILKGGVEAAVAAFPASIGLGGMAVGASGLRFTRHAAQLLSLGKERADEALRTQTGVNLLNNLMEAAQDTELGANHKETFNKLMKSNLEGTVHETAYVDSELLLEEEGGIEVFNQLAAAAGYTEEQINTLRETGAPIEINTADVVSTIAGASEINIADYVSFDAADRCFARNQKVAKELNGLLQKVKTEEVERTINNINTLTTEMFGETEERDLATMIIAEFEDPIAGIEERRMEINREISEMIDPVVEEMRGGMGQGVELYATDDYGNIIETGDGAHIGGAVRLSNNAPWYSKYYKANKKRPSEQELRELAEEVITGNNEYGVGDYDYTDPGMVEYAEETKARLENLRHELELLNNIEPKLKDVNKGDFAALDGLSEDGVKVYKAMYDLFRNAPIKKQQKAASMNALIYANVAERWAESHKLLGNKKVTPLDFMKRVRVEFGGEAATGAHNQYGGLEEAENRLREDEANFAKAIDLFMENKLEGQTTRVMRTPLVMELVGAQVLPVDISVKNLNKILKRKHADDITPELLKQIPRAMTDPLMIFDTYAGKRNQVRKVIVLDLKTDNGAVVIVPFELNTLNNKNNYVMNEVLSVYGKTDKNTGEASNVWLENQLKESKLQYINKKRASEVLDNEKLLSLMPYLKNGSSSSQIIADEEDLRKLRAINKGFYQTAWHGSPYNFQSFDLGAIGSGQGSQVHGWGLYFTKDKTVAKRYKEMLSNTLPSADEIMIGEKSLQQIYEDILNDIDYGNGDIDLLSEKQAMLENYMAGQYNADSALRPAQEMEYSKRSISWFKKLIKDVKIDRGSLFEVDVPENDVLLDEQKTFSEQSESVKKSLANIIDGFSDEQADIFWSRILKQQLKDAKEVNVAQKELSSTKTLLNALRNPQGNSVFAKNLNKKKLLNYGYTEERYEELLKDPEIAKEDIAKTEAKLNELQERVVKLESENDIRRNELLKNARSDYVHGLRSATGELIYQAITGAITNGEYDYKQGSLFLNENGIKGITYDGGLDGRCFVVFDDKAILVIDRFNQEAKRILMGQTIFDRDTGERVIKLFESADESTFIHEIAHVAYEDLRELASYENAPAQFKRDIKTLDDWANWNEEQLKEYVGTATYQEFAQMDALIREALGNGDVTRAEKLQRKWRQERFARGFEEYLKKGKAPTEGLRKVFYQFKTWLTKIYRAYRGIGGVPTKEVEAVMTRLLLTEEAIELAEKKAEIDAFEKSGVFNYLGDNAKAMWQKILEDVRKDATSKVLKIAMKDMSELAKRERQEKIDAEREAAYERLSKEPVWAVYSYLKYNPKMDTLAACKLFGLTVEEYVGLLKANGGSLERAVENYMVNYIAELEAPKKADIEAKAEEAMATSYYKTLLSAFETEMLQREVRREARLSKKLAGIVAKDETERAEIEKSLRELDKKGDEAKAQRALRDVAVGNVEKIRQYAKEKLALMDISYSANPVVWKNASRQKAAEMTEALAKKDYNKAVFASKMRLVYDAMADIATENKKLVDRKSKQMRDRAKTIRREKNMGANDRYVYNHLLYAFGLAERDVPKPPQFTTFNEVLISYDSTLSMPFIGDNGELLISDFIINAGTGAGKAVKGIHELTVSEFTELANVMDNIYTVAVEANKIKTVTTTEGETITVDQALAEITDDAFNRHKEKDVVDTTMAGNIKKMDDVLDTANRIHISLLKAETILDELSPKATKYIYDPIKRGAEKELKMTIEYGEKIEAIRQAWLDGKIEKYLNQGLGEDEARKAAEKEIEEAFTVERYKLGTSNITKENIIAFALNWGTEINRKRAMNYPGTTTRDFERIFAEMDGADWQFVTNVWDLFEETWPQLKQVEANVSGVTLEKQEGITFNVTGKDGANYIIQGKYYPIKYDPKKNQKVQRQQKEEGVRTNLPSMARMGVGIGMTKERAVSTSYLMRNDLGVFAEAIQENIHLICMREAVRDASRLINDERFADTIKRTLGGNALSALQDWVLDCWQLEPKVKNDFESAMAYLRRKQTTAVLAFRVSTALLNVANIGPVMHYLGMGRTKKALMDFYAHPIEQYNFVIERSAFVKNRAQTMDRDMRDVVKGKGIGDKMNKLEAMGFYMITKTDLMLACPLWLSEYQRVYRENAEQLSAEQIERMAVDAGDKAVRNVFGSGMVQDLAAVQRGGEVTKMLTMYYSYFSVVQQAVSKSVFEYNRRKVNGDDWYKRWAPVANTIVLWLIIPSAISAIIKMGIEAATGDDDDEITFENFIKRTGADTINAAAGGVPILRDVVNVAMAYAVEGKYYGARSTSIGETTEKMMDVIRSIKGFADDKKDLDDVLRAVFRATAYTTGIPVAGADALSTMYQWIAYGDATPEEVREYLTAILFDKKVKK